MKRTIAVEPAYDCILVQPCKFGSKQCVPGGGGSHGRHNEKWTYIVSDGEVALSLAVSSGIYLYPDGGIRFLWADDFYKKYGNAMPANQEHQSDAFWAALEALLVEQRAKAEDARTPKRCQHCDGRGIVRVEG